MKDTDYAYAVARIRANEGKLLTTAQVEALAALPSFEQAVAELHGCGWVETEQETDIAQIVFAQNLRLWQLLNESVPDREELKILTALNDFFNVKAALKCLLTDSDPAPLFEQPSSLDLQLLAQSVQKRAFDQLPAAFAAAAKQAYETALRTENGQSADVILDSAALRYLMAAARETKCALLRDILAFQCDSTNMKIALRCARTGKDLSFTESAVGDCAKLEKNLLCFSAVQGEGALLEYLLAGPYAEGASLLKDSAGAFEKWVDDRVMELARTAKYTFFGFEPICAYYFAKTAEIKTVRMILSAKQSGVSSAIIQERVRALYV